MSERRAAGGTATAAGNTAAGAGGTVATAGGTVAGDILALDVGTSVFKLGVFGPDLRERAAAHRSYEPRLTADGWADIEPKTWWGALRECCAEVRADLGRVRVVSLSVTTPGLTPMTEAGEALAPAILFLDGRSSAQAAEIRRRVGEEAFLRDACNLPVSGGSSLASMLWFRDCRPDVWARAARFGHCNTYVVKRLTGRWAIDPSTASITGLYNTARDDLTWSGAVLDAAGIERRRLPPLMRSDAPVGRILPSVARELGLPDATVVLCGGNDAVLAALSTGLTAPGDVNIISGTCDIAAVCTDRPVASPRFNVRCHVVPGRWLTFFVLNAGGEALSWFHRVACSEMSDRDFYETYVPGVLGRFFASPDAARESALPAYEPFLGGDRYSLERVTGRVSGLTLATSRDDLLLSIIRGNYRHLGEHLREVSALVRLNSLAGLSGGAAAIEGTVQARQRWTGDFEYVFREGSSLHGAAMLGRTHLATEAASRGAAIA